MAKTLHPACALVGYTVITALVFGGLLASPFDMFVVVGVPTCMAGTTSTPYPFTISATTGLPDPLTGPNAPNPTSVPFCSSDALLNSYKFQFVASGYLGIVQGSTDFWSAGQSVTVSPFCFKKSNGTCPSFGDLGVNSIKVTATATNKFQFTDPNFETTNFALAGGGRSFSQYNNYPITFQAGSILPVADGSKTYYIRNFGGSSFAIAADTTSAPLTFTSTTPDTNTITVIFPALSACASQQNVQAAREDGYDTMGNLIIRNPGSVNADGTLKTGSCGYCLTQPQQTGVLAVPGLCGTTIALLLIMELMMCMPFVRKMGFFRILVIVFSVLCMIFLIAAVASAAGILYQVLSCAAQTDFSQAQSMPSPTSAAAFGGYQPSSGGFSLSETGQRSSGRGLFNARQAPGPAAYLKTFLLPSVGAAQLIIAIVLLFLFTIVFAIKTDWTAVSSSAADSSQMMTPH